MATQIEQKPLFNELPVGQEVIFVVSNNAIVAGFTNVRFIADVYISDTIPVSPTTTSIPTATFKTTPNNAEKLDLLHEPTKIAIPPKHIPKKQTISK